ncbi:MAG: TldD/PmbA family protein [Alphaproteobacteria bacterium]|nr:TldD/PmbA family protein [Alphaproteobacteria bacterium]
MGRAKETGRDGSEDLNILSDLVASARAKGADAADALLARGVSLAQTRRLGETELLEREEGQDLGLRVIVGHKQAIVSSTDLGRQALKDIADRAVAMAQAVPDDPYCGLADPGQLITDIPDLDAADPAEPTQTELEARAAACEEAALGVEGVTNSEGASAAWGSTEMALVASNGFAGTRLSTSHSVSAAVIAGEGLGMQVDYAFSSAVYGTDLEDAHDVGTRAGERAVGRLNPRKVPTAQVPVVYDRRIAGRLLGHFAGAISGPSVARGTSFLRDKMDAHVFADGIRIIDDPFRPRGLRSRPFDGEGVTPERRALIEDGVLTGWLLDLASARQLGLETTGNAARGTSAPPSPSPSNLYMEAGSQTVNALIADIDQGFFVTELIGHGVNLVTGDYSMGAGGFWIEKGEITYPVSELTIAGKLTDMFRHLTPADDLEFRYGTNVPTSRVDGMTVAGAN